MPITAIKCNIFGDLNIDFVFWIIHLVSVILFSLSSTFRLQFDSLGIWYMHPLFSKSAWKWVNESGDDVISRPSDETVVKRWKIFLKLFCENGLWLE